MAQVQLLIRNAPDRWRLGDNQFTQAAKLLGDTSVPTFYPSLFAMVAAVLETFGTMVFDRIRSRAEVAEDAVLLLPTAPGTGGGYAPHRDGSG